MRGSNEWLYSKWCSGAYRFVFKQLGLSSLVDIVDISIMNKHQGKYA
jgi:hypothetical protein